MQRHFKKLGKTLLTVSLMIGTISYYLLFPLLTGLAAPTFLPNCGQDPVTGSFNSGPPDIARSADETNTAVVWAEGDSGIGQILLAYSDSLTTTRTWNTQTVDATLVDGAPGNQNPTIAFHPSGKTTVHIAYQKKGSGVSNSGISYAKCTLGGSCTRRTINSGDTTFNRTNPQIAVNGVGDPVIVYQETRTNVTPQRTYLRYAFIENKGSGTIHQGLDPSVLPNNEVTTRERNPTVAYANNKVHVALVKANNDNDSTAEAIQYFNFSVAGNLSGGSLTSGAFQTFNPGSGVSKPDFPALAALGATNTVALVWQVTKGSNFNLAYNFSNNNGTSWIYQVGASDYRYIPSNNTSFIGSAAGDARPNINAVNDIFKGNLHPDVTMQLKGAISVTHVAWQESQLADIALDIMYTRFDGNKNPDTTTWAGTPILSGTTSAITITGVTDVYNRESVIGEFPNAFDHSALPKILFGKPANRLQVAYLSIKGTGLNLVRQVLYNGWQLGQAGQPSPLGFKDSDCDTISDAVELVTPPVCGDPLEGTFNSRHEYDCDDDGVPDFLDPNADNDAKSDDTDSDWRFFDPDAGGILLPVILKN